MPPENFSSAESAQARFDAAYITSAEVCKDLGVSRTSVFQAQKRGYLPKPVKLVGTSLYVWERATAQPFIDAWRVVLNARRKFKLA